MATNERLFVSFSPLKWLKRGQKMDFDVYSFTSPICYLAIWKAAEAVKELFVSVKIKKKA